MKFSKPIMALSCALLLAGCADPVTTGTTGTSEADSTISTPSDTETNPGSSDAGSTGTMTLAELIAALEPENYTAKVTILSGAAIYGTTTDISLSKDEFIYLLSEDEGYYYGPVEQGTAAMLFSGSDILDAQLLSPAKVTPWNFVYTVLDIIGDGSDWTLESGSEYAADEASDSAMMAIAYAGYDYEAYECYAPTLTIAEDGANLNYGIGYDGESVMTVDIDITNIGTTEYDCPADLNYTFTAPTEWGETVDYYAPSLGLDFPTGAFGVGYYATVDEYYGVVSITDPTADFDAFKAAIDPILEGAGYELDEEYSSDGYYSWYSDSVYFDYYYYTAEETGAPDIYPQGVLYVDILDMSSYY